MAIHKILVTGSNGQLGWELAQAAKAFPQFEFVFVDRNAIDLSKPVEFESAIQLFAPDAIINTAAYTAVDKAETEKDLAHTVNAEAVASLAGIAKKEIFHLSLFLPIMFLAEMQRIPICQTQN